MNDIWGYDSDELPMNPSISRSNHRTHRARRVRDLAKAVQEYMQENFGGYTREQFLERLEWRDDYAEVRVRWYDGG